MTTRKLLIFPAGMPRSLAFQRECERAGVATVGASSLVHDPSRPNYGDWTFLPYVVEPGFAAALVRALQDHAITGIYTPNLVVWDQLQVLLPQLAPQVRLVNPAPVATEEAPYLDALARATQELARPLQLAADGTPQPRSARFALAALLRLVDNVPGMCDNDKTAALCEVARYAPEGDLVEIGSWWGKSALLLALLARQHGLGALLCVDPWQDEHLLQRDAAMVDATARTISAERAFEIFTLNLLPLANGRVNRLRSTSVEAADTYRAGLDVNDPAFGHTRYSGRIALLHIDGNHERQAVQGDIDAWGPLVRRDGGWIVFDDYVWPYGNGPRLVADAWCDSHAAEVGCAFVMGSALFVQLRGA